MPKVKILEHFGDRSLHKVGDIVDITNPARLIEEGKVELYVAKKKTTKKAAKKVKKAE